MGVKQRRDDHWPDDLSFLPKFLFRPDIAIWRYVAGATCLSILGNLLLSGVAVLLLPDHAPPPMQNTNRVVVILAVVVLSPVVETAIMAMLLSVLARFPGPGPAVIISAILWGFLHGTVSLRWGIGIWWSFLVFSIAFVTWSRSRGFARGLFVATAIHALQNSCAVLLLFLAGLV